MVRPLPSASAPTGVPPAWGPSPLVRLPDLPGVLAHVAALLARGRPPGLPRRGAPPKRDAGGLFREPGLAEPEPPAAPEGAAGAGDGRPSAALPPPATEAYAPAAPWAAPVVSAGPVPDEAPPVESAGRGATPASWEPVARLRLVLAPPDLGALRLDLALRRTMLHATVRAARPEAAAAILAQLPALREALARRGFTLGDLTVTADEAVPPGPDGAGWVVDPDPARRVDVEA